MSKATTGVKVAALAATSALLLAACGGSDSGDTGSTEGGGEAVKGGTLTLLANQDQIFVLVAIHVCKFHICYHSGAHCSGGLNFGHIRKRTHSIVQQ